MRVGAYRCVYARVGERACMRVRARVYVCGVM